MQAPSALWSSEPIVLPGWELLFVHGLAMCYKDTNFESMSVGPL